MKKQVSRKIKEIMNASNMEAKSNGDSMIKPEHIVISILQDEKDNICKDVLKKMRLDIEKIISQIDTISKQNLIGGYVSNTKKLPLSAESKKILKDVTIESEKYSGTEIELEHLFLTILDSKTPLSNIFKVSNITYDNFLTNLNRLNEEKTINNMNDLLNENEGLNKNQNPIRRTTKTEAKSKTPVLDNFCRDLTKLAENGDLDPVVGREKEIKRIIQVLSRKNKQNPILIGKSGVGKSAIVEGLSTLIIKNEVPRILSNKRILSLELATVVAGTKYRGQFEERMMSILDECKKNKDVILFIDELHTIVGAGNASGSLDASNIFKPAMARGEIQIIGATTFDEFRENIEKDTALTRRFQQVILDEPSIEDTIEILTNVKSKYENHHKVKYTDEAIVECVKLADRYITDRAMPDKALDVLDESGSIVNLIHEKPTIIKELEIKRDELNEKKKQVVKEQNFEEAAKLRDKEKEILYKLDFEIGQWQSILDNNETIVDVEIVSEVVSNMTGIPVSKLNSNETKNLINLDKELEGKIIGQNEAVTKVVKAIKRSKLGIGDKNKPNVLFFLGQSGTGKTYLTKLIAENVFGDVDSLIRVDMSELMEKHSVSKLIGTTAGYVGYEQGGQLTEKVRRKPYSVILFDEIEKAHEDVFNLMLQLFDEGHLTDGLGRKVNFKNTIIIMTSNIGVKEVSEFGKGIGFNTSNSPIMLDERKKDIINKSLKKKFKPEFLNRVDEIITFNSLKEDDILKIVSLEIDKLKKRLSEEGYNVSVTKSVVKFIADNCYDEQYGARPIKRGIQTYIEDAIADLILSNEINENEVISVTLNKDKKVIALIKRKK